jgi:hypothetical protein
VVTKELFDIKHTLEQRVAILDLKASVPRACPLTIAEHRADRESQVLPGDGARSNGRNDSSELFKSMLSFMPRFYVYFNH